jgi:hypothetical protein
VRLTPTLFCRHPRWSALDLRWLSASAPGRIRTCAHGSGYRAEAKLAQPLAHPGTPEYLTADESYRLVALPSVSVHLGTTSVPMCQPSLYPHDSEHGGRSANG